MVTENYLCCAGGKKCVVRILETANILPKAAPIWRRSASFHKKRAAFYDKGVELCMPFGLLGERDVSSEILKVYELSNRVAFHQSWFGHKIQTSSNSHSKTSND